MNDIKSILQNLGYTLTDDGACWWRTKPVYRNSDNPTSLRISKKNGGWTDFSENIGGPFYKLVQLTLGFQKPKEAKKWLEENQYVRPTISTEAPKIVMAEIFSPTMLDKLIKDHHYWNNRGIRTETLEEFQGGVAGANRMANRYVFPIFSNQETIIGFTGRDLTGKSPMKYKHIGEKSKWVWPRHVNEYIIREEKEVILVESPACVLKLYDCGVKNTLCLFGTGISDSIICFLIGCGLKRIIIATNNEPENFNIGNEAAEKIYNRLLKFFDPHKLKIALPVKKDFGEQTCEENLLWYKQLEN